MRLSRRWGHPTLDHHTPQSAQMTKYLNTSPHDRVSRDWIPACARARRGHLAPVRARPPFHSSGWLAVKPAPHPCGRTLPYGRVQGLPLASLCSPRSGESISLPTGSAPFSSIWKRPEHGARVWSSSFKFTSDFTFRCYDFLHIAMSKWPFSFKFRL